MSLSATVTGGELTYEVAGAGVPAVLCHQYRSVSADSSLGRALAPHLRVHAVNPRGLAGSGPVRGEDDLSMDGFAQDLSELRTTLGLDPWVAVGSSTGGMVALLHALADSQSVRALVLVSTAASQRFVQGSLADPTHPRAAEAQEAAALAKTDPAASVQRMFELSVADPKVTPSLPAGDDANNSQERMGNFMRTLPGFDLEPRLAELRIPALVIAGRHDPQIPVANGERMAEALPQARLHICEKSGHYPHIEQPDEFRAVVSDWIGDVLD